MTKNFLYPISLPSIKGQEISKAIFLETPLPKKGPKVLKDF
jgi:hypothetical protein